MLSFKTSSISLDYKYSIIAKLEKLLWSGNNLRILLSSGFVNQTRIALYSVYDPANKLALA